MEYNKDTPFPAKIIERTLLSGDRSTKKTYHITLDLSGSGISYRPGDSIAIFPENRPEDVTALLSTLGKSGKELVFDPRTGKEMLFSDFLKTKANLIRIPASLLDEEDKAKRADFIANHDLIDFFERHPSTLPLQDLIAHFAPLLPRFYSIASSPLTHPETVDLLVATFTYTHGKKERPGLGPHFLTEGAALHATPIETYLHPTPHFLLPKDPSVPIIMIGPGTGVAPYRAFLKQREKEGATGTNWLFFGERNKHSDYYYASYFNALEKKGRLTLDLAFSRDQQEKLYVQHRLLEKGNAIWDLLANGAHIYICGDARKMAKDVTNALASIIETHSSHDPKTYLKQLRKEKRLLLDVY